MHLGTYFALLLNLSLFSSRNSRAAVVPEITALNMRLFWNISPPSARKRSVKSWMKPTSTMFGWPSTISNAVAPCELPGWCLHESLVVDAPFASSHLATSYLPCCTASMSSEQHPHL